MGTEKSIACIETGRSIVFEGFKFIPGAENSLCDDLSRGVAFRDLSVKGLIDFGRTLAPVLQRARDFCDPRIDTTDDGAFFEFWEGLRVFLDSVRNGAPSDFEMPESDVQDDLQPPLEVVAPVRPTLSECVDEGGGAL